MSDIAKQLGQRIRELRTQRHMSQEELSFKAGISPAHLGQIERDFTFGKGGGTLDLNGCSMDWYEANTQVDAKGFSINALTEEAVIANGSGTSSLVYKETGNRTFLGSFRDSATGSLSIDYQGGGVWSLHGIHTDLQNHSESLFTVSNGK